MTRAGGSWRQHMDAFGTFTVLREAGLGVRHIMDVVNYS
jgi:hypothetical protein